MLLIQPTQKAARLISSVRQKQFKREKGMSECKKLPDCSFFDDKMVNMPSTAEVFKKYFCYNNFTNCAKYIVSEVLGKRRNTYKSFSKQKERAIDKLFKKASMPCGRF